ncbi:hypothetical protein J1763_gp77 [Gordonia phage YorkOnyx]|uniref:Uncharacterized protein n=1 Tax=Gordonia phage YorkOnyx TaxID=2762402 RepID=A0A7G8LMC6_9CAUD|nr:hypothetical protein J1763_gp77 [Gordonia phage YorkOnyx]QNJ58398.1 hypothetical protein SEA_YORKONYX_77 [Gordonia phage YorkOnyx]
MSRVGRWVPATCSDSDRIHRGRDDLGALQGLTEMHDDGEMHYMRVWGTLVGEPVLRDVRDITADTRDEGGTCEHWVWQDGGHDE